MLLAAGLVLALGVWAFLFGLPRRGLWTRTWVAAALLSGFSVAALVATDRLADSVGPLTVPAALAGLAAGAAWLGATHGGYAVLARILPGFAAQVDDLYRAGDRDRRPVVVGAVVSMGVAEELFFRGFVQDRAGLAVAVAAYVAVQTVERKWALSLAALLGGTVWGLLFWATGGLLAPVIAHVLWTGALTFVWPLGGRPAAGHGPAPPSPTVPADRRGEEVP